MSDVISQLIGGGVVDSRGVFTVDAKKAQEKLERFRLADPLGYVVELVQAAGLCGATFVDVEVTASLFRLRFDGRAFGASDLQDLESAVLVRNDLDHPARQQLALGVSAARALDPRFVSVQSETTKLLLDDEGSSHLGDQPALESPFTTQIEVQEAFRIGHFVEFFQGAFGMQKEERLLAERCRHARFTVSVNGVVVSHKPPPTDVQIDVIEDGFVGSFGYRFGSFLPGRLMILRAGVVQESVLFVDEGACAGLPVPRGFVAVVDAPHLPRDASFSRFIRNDAFNALVRSALKRAAPAAQQLLRAGDDGSGRRPAALAVPDDHHLWAHDVVRDVLASLGAPARTSTNKQIAALRSLPLFTDALGAPLTFDAILEDMRRHGHAATVAAKRTALHLKPPRPVLLVDEVVEQWMARLGVPLKDITTAVDEADKRELSQTRFRARRTLCNLPTSASFAAQVRFDASENERGVIGFRSGGAEPAQIIVVVDGCELAHLSVPFVVPGLSIVVEGAFTPTFNYDDVVRNAALSKALVRAAAAIPLLFDGLRRAPGRHREALVACLALYLDGSALAAALLEAAGCPKHPVNLETLSLDHPAATARLFTTMGRDEVSLEELTKDQGPIGVVGVDVINFTPSVRPTLRAGEVLRAVLRKVVPHRPLISMNDEALQARRRQELRDRNPETLAIADVSARVAVSTRLEVAGSVKPVPTVVTGFVGHRPGGARAKLELAVYCEGRRLQVAKLAAPVSGLIAALNDDRLELTGKLQPHGSIDHLVGAALAAVPKLMAALADPWPLAVDVVSCLLPTDQHRQALARLQANLPPKEVGPAWTEVLLLSAESSPNSDGDVAAALELVLAEGAVPTVDRVAEVVGGKKKKATTDARVDFLGSALGSPGLVDEGPLLTRVLEVFGIDEFVVARLDGSTTTLAELLTQGVARSVSQAAPMVKGFGDVVVLSTSAAAVMARLRELPIEDASAALAEAAARLAFEQKQNVAAVIDADVATLVRTRIDDDGLHGEVALLPGAAALKPAAELVLLHKGKHLARVAVGQFVGMALLAVVDADDVTPTGNFDGVEHDAKLTRVIERLRAARDELVADLVDDVQKAGASEKVSVRARLLERLRISHTDKRKAMPKTGLAARIADLAFFPTVVGVDIPLRDQGGDDDCVRFLSAPVRSEDVPPGFDDVVIIQRAAERELMDKILEIDDVEKSFAAAARLHETRKRLPALCFDIVEDVLVQHTTHIGKAQLRMGLPRTHPDHTRLQMRVGHDGLLVESLGAPLVPCNGVLSGENVVAKDLRSARVDDKLLQSIARESAVLWGKAIDVFNKGESNDDDHRALRAWLHHGALRFVNQDAGKVPGWLTALRLRLLDVRVLPLDGAFISLNTAIQEQPPALAKLLRQHALVRLPPPVAVAASEAPVDVPEPVYLQQPLPPPPPPVQAAPEPAPAPPSDHELLEQRLVQIIAVVRERSKGLTSDLELNRLVIANARGKVAARVDKSNNRVVVDLDHPLSRAALQSAPALAMLASLVVTRINDRLESVSDDDERRFLSSLIAHARTLEAG